MNDMYKLKWTVLQCEIFRLFCFKSGEYLGVREIARLLEVSPTAVSKSLKYFEENELIKKEEKNKTFALELNFQNPEVVRLKRAENLKIIYESGLLDLLVDKFAESTIILFGSYSYGEDSINSDIDLAIINSNEKKVELAKFELKLERKISLHFFKSFKEIDKNLRENIFNGILLKGGIEL